MKKTTNTNYCPLRKALKVIGGKWNMIIIEAIGTDEVRFNQLKKAIPDISEKVLIQKLKDLAQCEIIVRKDFNQVPPKVTYKLSKMGLKALTVTEQVSTFGEELK